MFLALFTLSITTWKATTKDGTEAVDEDDDDEDDDEDEEPHAGPEEARGPASLPPVVGQSPSGGTGRGDGDVHLICRNILVTRQEGFSVASTCQGQSAGDNSTLPEPFVSVVRTGDLEVTVAARQSGGHSGV